jgi:hypothetical protein
MSEPADFARDWYAVVRGIVDRARADDLHAYALAVADSATAADDSQVPGSQVAYGLPRMDELLEDVRGRVEGATGLDLWPTYSYCRVYRRGSRLEPHTDRPSCEISLSVGLGRSSAEPWPLFVVGPRGTAAVELAPGDGLVYRGIDCYHWREALRGDHAAQVFLHYVDRHGPHAEWRFDKRPGLTSPRSSR